MIKSIFKISESIRYVAIYKNGKLETHSKDNTDNLSSSESDKCEELIVNPVLLTAASQRCNIDCGVLDYLLVRYGNFFQFIFQKSWVYVSICIEKNTDAITVGNTVKSFVVNQS